MGSVRFICGTQEEHKLLEKKISSFLGTGDSILYSSCFNANTGLFETLLDNNDAIISDELNHASIRRFDFKLVMMGNRSQMTLQIEYVNPFLAQFVVTREKVVLVSLT